MCKFGVVVDVRKCIKNLITGVKNKHDPESISNIFRSVNPLKFSGIHTLHLNDDVIVLLISDECKTKTYRRKKVLKTPHPIPSRAVSHKLSNKSEPYMKIMLNDNRMHAFCFQKQNTNRASPRNEA